MAKLKELGAHPKLVRAFEELPAVIGGHSFLGSNSSIELRNVEVAIYWNERKEKDKVKKQRDFFKINLTFSQLFLLRGIFLLKEVL